MSSHHLSPDPLSYQDYLGAYVYIHSQNPSDADKKNEWWLGTGNTENKACGFMLWLLDFGELRCKISVVFA